MIIQQAFQEPGKFLKGGLHCHTTRSDGEGTPEEVIRYHHDHGYDFLAITDHRIYNLKNFAPDVPITIIPAAEIDKVFEGGETPEDGFRTFHTICLGPAKEDGNGFEQDQPVILGEVKNQFDFQKYLDMAHEKGNITIYCHPMWSSTPARYFDQLKGNFAMEIWNTGCVHVNGMDYDAAYWDELLGQGQEIWGVATDDGHAMAEHCRGWVMVKAENSISAILQALQAGAFYSSCGPEIYNFYVDGESAVIECSPAAQIRFQCDMHPSAVFRSADASMTSCRIDHIGRWKYIRATVIDKEGRYAWTNPIFLRK